MTKTIETDPALWDLALAKAEEIELAHRGQFRLRSRSAGMWTQNPGISVTMHLTLASADGEVLLYVVEVREPFKYGRQQGPSVEVNRFRAFDDKYWPEQVDSDPAARVVVDGVHYRLGPNRPGNNDLKGFAGRRWEIEYLDDRPGVVTNDLWYQGRIPEQYRPLLPDNARFVL